MIIAELKLISNFANKHPTSRGPLNAWVALAKRSNWSTPSAVKKDQASADFLSNNRIIFNIGGNKYRLIVEAVYQNNLLIILGVYTHAEYSKKQF